MIFKSAALGPTGATTGYTAGAQFFGATFTLPTTHTITGIGGHLFVPSPPATIWGAIVAVPPSPTSIPTFAPADIEAHALASAQFSTPASGSADVLEPVNVVLGPGEYALVFGGRGLFGTTGSGVMAVNPGPASPSRYFVGLVDGVPGGWFQTKLQAGGAPRFVVEGFETAAVPEPGTSALWLLLAVTAVPIVSSSSRHHS